MSVVHQDAAAGGLYGIPWIHEDDQGYACRRCNGAEADEQAAAAVWRRRLYFVAGSVIAFAAGWVLSP